MENTKIIILVFLASFKCLVCYSQSNLVDNEGEAYFYHINDFPHDGDVFWGGDNYAANGIASDDNYMQYIDVFMGQIGRNEMACIYLCFSYLHDDHHCIDQKTTDKMVSASSCWCDIVYAFRYSFGSIKV